jgi:hypothetical protein
MNHLRTRLDVRPTAPRATSPQTLWRILGGGLGFMALTLVAGLGLGAWVGGLAGAVGGLLLGPVVGGLALSGWLLVGLAVRLVLPPREGTGAGSTMLIVTGCAWLAAVLGLAVALVCGAAVQGGLIAGAITGLLAGLMLDVALYE